MLSIHHRVWTRIRSARVRGTETSVLLPTRSAQAAAGWQDRFDAVVVAAAVAAVAGVALQVLAGSGTLKLVGALLVAAAPPHDRFESEAQRQRFAERAGRVMGLAAETFNDGLRAYYFSFAAMAWFFSAWAMMAGTAGVIFVLYRREFHSDVLAVLRGDGPASP